MEILLALVIGFGGGWHFKEPSKSDCKDEALVIASCPQLTKLDDSSFGGHIIRLQEVAVQYRTCRTACIK